MMIVQWLEYTLSEHKWWTGAKLRTKLGRLLTVTTMLSLIPMSVVLWVYHSQVRVVDNIIHINPSLDCTIWLNHFLLRFVRGENHNQGENRAWFVILLTLQCPVHYNNVIMILVIDRRNDYWAATSDCLQ